MKKYHQLLLLLLSLISLTLLLVYRHQYNRLHYVLEVFNFFGQPCNVSDLEISDSIVTHHDWGPTPVWQQSESIHTYSAFWTDKEEVSVIAVNENKANTPKDCYLWYEDKLQPTIGKFKYSKIDTDSKEVGLYLYTCNLSEYKHVPYAVSFASKGRRNLPKKVLVRPANHKIAFNATLCVTPSSTFNKSEFLEFLSFHSLIGVNSFLFYTDNIPYRLQKIITNLSPRLNIKLSFLPWYFSSRNHEVIQKIIETDCLLRALPNSKTVITVNMNEYIVPSGTFDDVLKLLTNENRPQKIRLPIQTFCIKNVHQKKPIALQNTDVTYFNDNHVRDVVTNAKQSEMVQINSLDKNIASVHRYVFCNQTARTYTDNTMLKYSKDFLRSTLIQLYLHEHI